MNNCLLDELIKEIAEERGWTEIRTRNLIKELLTDHADKFDMTDDEAQRMVAATD